MSNFWGAVQFSDDLNIPSKKSLLPLQYSGLNLNQDKATKPQTVQIVRQGEATPYWFKVNPLYLLRQIEPIRIRLASRFFAFPPKLCG